MTERRIMNRWLAAVAMPGIALAGNFVLATPAQAQATASRVARPQVLQDGGKTITPAPPPALPGSKASGDTVIPADRAPGDMAPNEALFDAINRGDIGAAKDALNRGAELDARNVLGQTPLDLSIDIGRNDISFLLLSMRGGEGRGHARPAAVAQAPAAPPARPPVRSDRVPRQTASAVPAPPQTPQLFAGNGGAPVPQAGFLGFGSARTP